MCIIASIGYDLLLGQDEPKLEMDKITVTDPVEGEMYCIVHTVL